MLVCSLSMRVYELAWWNGQTLRFISLVMYHPNTPRSTQRTKSIQQANGPMKPILPKEILLTRKIWVNYLCHGWHSHHHVNHIIMSTTSSCQPHHHVNHIIMPTTHHQVVGKCNSSAVCEFTGESTLSGAKPCVFSGNVAESSTNQKTLKAEGTGAAPNLCGRVRGVSAAQVVFRVVVTLLLSRFATGCDKTHWHGCAKQSMSDKRDLQLQVANCIVTSARKVVCECLWATALCWLREQKNWVAEGTDEVGERQRRSEIRGCSEKKWLSEEVVQRRNGSTKKRSSLIPRSIHPSTHSSNHSFVHSFIHWFMG